MELSWDKNAWEDYMFWQSIDKNSLKRVNELLKETLRTPFEGKGKPEALKGNLTGYWSKRINAEHRFVYKVFENSIHIISCRYH